MLIMRGRHPEYRNSLAVPDYSHYAKIARIVRQHQTSPALGTMVDRRLHTSEFYVEGEGLRMFLVSFAANFTTRIVKSRVSSVRKS